MRKTAFVIIGIIFAVTLLVLPQHLSTASQALLSRTLIACLFTAGFSLLAGQMGLLSFGHAAFFGLGAFACMHAMIWVEKAGGAWPTPLLPLFGMAAGALTAIFVGLLAAKRGGAYFSLITLAIAELIHVIATQWNVIFGGESGLTSMRSPWLGFDFGTTIEVYYCTLAWTVIALLLVWLFTRTALGRIALAIGENEERGRFLGYNVYRYKIAVFAISGALSGMAGGLLAMGNESVSYTVFAPSVSLEVALFTYIGGTALFAGPIAAAVLLTLVPSVLSSITRLWPLYQGVLFMLLMLYSPGGLSGAIVSLRARPKDGTKHDIFRKLIIALGILLMMGAFVSASELTYRTSEGIVQTGIASAFADFLNVSVSASAANYLRLYAWTFAVLFFVLGGFIVRLGLKAPMVLVNGETGFPEEEYLATREQ